jgi:hypothetical protein
MALKSVLVLGPTGRFGQLVIPELIHRKASLERIGAFMDNRRLQSPGKARALQDYAEKGVVLVEASPGDPTPFKSSNVLRVSYY